MGFSYSKINCHWDCPYHYKLRYIDKLDTVPDMSPNNALYVGTAIHEGIEHNSILHAFKTYRSSFGELDYRNLDDRHFAEMKKLSHALPLTSKLPRGEYEYKLLDSDGFIGYIDLLVKNDDGTYSIYDFKHTNNMSGYLKSGQIHVYKYYFERLTGSTVSHLYYVFIPKVKEVVDENHSLRDLDEIINKFYSKNDISVQEVEFDRKYVNQFFARKAMMDKDKLFEKHHSYKCSWCEFNKFCVSRGKDKSELTDESKDKLISVVEEVPLF